MDTHDKDNKALESLSPELQSLVAAIHEDKRFI